MKKLFVFLFAIFSFSASANFISCKDVDNKIKFDMTLVDGVSEFIISLEDERGVNDNFILTGNSNDETSLFFSMIDLTNASSLEFTAREDFEGYDAELVDLGSPGSEAKTYKLNCNF